MSGQICPPTPLADSTLSSQAVIKGVMRSRGTLFPEVPTTLSGDELGWRLAGFVDGEGCFHIARNGKGSGLNCRFTIGVRADDLPILELFQRSLGIGRVYHITPNALAISRRPGVQPQCHWVVAPRDQCAELIRVLDLYPPISKKRGDFLHWRVAVDAWYRHDWDEMVLQRDQLMASREYVPATVAASRTET